MSTTNESLTALREILHREPSVVAFAALCEVLDGWGEEDQAVALGYAREHLEASWPQALRVPSRDWAQRAERGDWPWAWSLATGGFNVEVYYIGYRRPEVLQVVRRFSGLGLRAVRSLADGCPAVVLSGASREVASEARDTLTALGAVADVLPWEPEEEGAERFAVWLTGTLGVTLGEASEALYGAGWLRAFRQIRDFVGQLPYLLRDDLCERHAQALASELGARGLRIRVQPSEGLRFRVQLGEIPASHRLAALRYLDSRGLPGDSEENLTERLSRWRLTRLKANEVRLALEKLGLSAHLEPG